MIGQHIFVRCRNEQNNAGTWTAAITDGILDRDIVRNYIEPRCNMDEAFAQRALLNTAGNNVLRIYHIGDATTVVSRTYWVTDRITEAMGRKGAYSISYVLTDDDVLRFCSDFGGAFDTNCFESYDALVERTQQNKITINTSYDLFSHGQPGYAPSVFKAVGFTKESFIALMNGIYNAVENKKQLAVLLPAELRRAWEESGDATAEKLAFHIMSLIPDFTRINLGIAAHWSCQIRDKMVSDMHLVFVHPKSEEDIAYLKREQIMLLDLDSGRHTSNIPIEVTDYFGMLWDSLENRDAIEEFWSYTKSKYRKLLRGRPNSARAIESVYLIRSITQNDFTDTSKLLPAFLLVASEFAGAGTKVPDAEEFLHKVMGKLDFTAKSLASNIERVICTLMQYDPDQTSHQTEEYDALIHACVNGNASDDTIEALCDEVLKKERNAAAYYRTYVSEYADLPAKSATPQLLKFLCGLFTRLSENGESSELLHKVIEALATWSQEFFEAENFPMLDIISQAYIKYLGTKANNAQISEIVYGFLFEYEQKADPTQREVCTKVLFREERRMYKSDGDMFDGSAYLRLFATTFIRKLCDITKLKKDVAINCYTRMFRMAYKGDTEITNYAIESYKNAITASEEAGISDRVVPVLLSCEEDALKQIENETAIWDPQTVGDVLIKFEVINTNLLKNYAPSEERVGYLVKWFNKTDVTAYRVCTFYLSKMQLGARQQFYKKLLAGDLISNLFVHTLFAGEKPELVQELENCLGADHPTKLNIIMSTKLIEDPSYDSSSVESIFSVWYTAALTKQLREIPFEPNRQFEANSEILLREYRAIASMYSGNASFRVIAKTVLDKFAYDIFSAVGEHSICEMSVERVREAINIVRESTYEQEPETMALFRAVQTVDAAIAERRSASIEAMCQNVRQNGQEELVSQRIKFHIDTAQNPDRVKHLWLYYYLLYSRDVNSYPLEEYLDAMGLSNSSNSEIGVYLVGLLNDMAMKKSQYEFEVGYSVMRYLYGKISQSPQSFMNNEFLRLLYNIRMRDYVRNSGVTNLLKTTGSSSKLRFNLPMFCKCLAGSIVTFVLAILSFWALIMLGRIDTFVMVSVGAFIFIVLAVASVCLMPRKNSRFKDNRRT